MSRNDWHEDKMGTCGCGRWAKVLDGMCAECHDAEQQYQKEAAYLKRIRELELALLDVKAGSDEPHILQIVEEALEPPR